MIIRAILASALLAGALILGACAAPAANQPVAGENAGSGAVATTPNPSTQETPMPSTPDQNATSGPTAPGLDGTSWNLTDLNGSKPVGTEPVTLEFFEPGRVGGMSSCNRYMGGFTVDAATISFTQMAGTMMACEQPLMDQEQVYLQLLSKGSSFAITGDVLTITADDGATLTFARA